MSEHDQPDSPIERRKRLESMYDELRKVAKRVFDSKLRDRMPIHTLQGTGLANELFLKLTKTEKNIEELSNEQLLAYARTACHNILNDYVGKKNQLKGCGSGETASMRANDYRFHLAQNLEKLFAEMECQAVADSVDLADAFIRLAEDDPHASEVIELRLAQDWPTVRELSELLGVSKSSVQDRYDRGVRKLRTYVNGM